MSATCPPVTFQAPQTLCAFIAPLSLPSFSSPHTLCSFDAEREIMHYPSSWSSGCGCGCGSSSSSCSPCIGECNKHPEETMPIQIDWSRAALCMQEGECVGAYKLISVAHTVQQADGSALPGTALDLQVATDANGNAMEYVDSSRGISRVFVRLGNEKTQYRIKVTATFTDCGLTWTSVKCVSVFVTEA